MREELDRFRRENEALRRSFQLTRSTTGDLEKTFGTPSASVDSGVETSMSGTLKSATALQVEVKELREREGKLYDEIQSLRRVR